MSEKILNIINEEKEKYFETLKEHKVFVNDYDIPSLLSIVNVSFSVSFSFSLVFFFVYYLKDFINNTQSFGLFLFFILLMTTFCLSTAFASVFFIDDFLINKAYKKFKNNDYNMNQYMLSYFDKQFNNKKISNQLQNQIKIDFSMDEYKFLLSDNKKFSDIKYNDIHNFLSKRESINQHLEQIEQEKYMLLFDESMTTQKEIERITS